MSVDVFVLTDNENVRKIQKKIGQIALKCRVHSADEVQGNSAQCCVSLATTPCDVDFTSFVANQLISNLKNKIIFNAYILSC